jgi:hypothetical protein
MKQKAKQKFRENKMKRSEGNNGDIGLFVSTSESFRATRKFNRIPIIVRVKERKKMQE